MDSGLLPHLSYGDLCCSGRTCTSLSETLLSILWDVHPDVGLLDRMAVLWSFLRTLGSVSAVALLFLCSH